MHIAAIARPLVGIYPAKQVSPLEVLAVQPSYPVSEARLYNEGDKWEKYAREKKLPRFPWRVRWEGARVSRGEGGLAVKPLGTTSALKNPLKSANF